MKAIVYENYGTPDNFKNIDVSKPSPENDEVLIKIKATAINAWDWDLLTGKPLWARTGGLLKPRYKILGADVAGIVEAIGPTVTNFKIGDEVFGDLSECGWGGFAEYVCAKQNALILKPKTMCFEQAAALPQAGVMALQALIEKRKIRCGDRVLINGAGGGVGTIAIQVAKHFGAHITAVDQANKLDALLELGADEVLDYQQQDFSRDVSPFDLIIDVVARRSLFTYRRALNPGGVFVFVGGTPGFVFRFLSLGIFLSQISSKKFTILVLKANKNLDQLVELCQQDVLNPPIDRLFPLDQTADAFEYFQQNRFIGKIVITTG
ncbi:MAG: NAD(P)-dependent alcohol dehydrogenase [Gammaproteobacteria bacterium]|nr:NAD(P)-dependent alcohol dehydrogenase [Gammaproteobacteria bacterium]